MTDKVKAEEEEILEKKRPCTNCDGIGKDFDSFLGFYLSVPYCLREFVLSDEEREKFK